MNSDFKLSTDFIDLSKNTALEGTNLSANTLGKNWYINGETFYNKDTINYSFTQPGFYDLTLISHHGACRDTVTKTIEVVDSIVSPNQLYIYPNPSKGDFTIKSHEIIKQLKLFNSLGEIVYSNEIKYTTAELKLQHLPKGIYLLKIQLANGNFVHRKLIFQ